MLRGFTSGRRWAQREYLPATTGGSVLDGRCADRTLSSDGNSADHREETRHTFSVDGPAPGRMRQPRAGANRRLIDLPGAAARGRRRGLHRRRADQGTLRGDRSHLLHRSRQVPDGGGHQRRRAAQGASAGDRRNRHHRRKSRAGEIGHRHHRNHRRGPRHPPNRQETLTARMAMMRKVLVANRGEIACRLMRSCRKLDLATVAVCSEADRGALHVELAGEHVMIGPAPARDSYLSGEKIIAAAKATGADAVHPGYGFLSENERFAESVRRAGLVWIGPDPASIANMGDKERARLLAKAAGLPILEGSARFAPDNLHGLAAAAAATGFPLLVKAAAGGGGIGMRRVDSAADLEAAVVSTQGLAAKAFGDGAVYLERFIEPARHIEVQIFGFGDGRAVHLFERECSIQRRFQKILEESPAPGLAAARRAGIAEAAVGLARQERYCGAGTVEFVADAAGDFFFLAMNTRIQGAHPVT